MAVGPKEPAGVDDTPGPFELLSIHQDFAWFASLLGWSLVLVLWRWHPHRRSTWAWIPWTATAAIITAVANFALFNPPFAFLADRAVQGGPGPPEILPAAIYPPLLCDLITGVALALAGGGWLWLIAQQQSARTLRWLAWPVALALALLHRDYPISAMSLLGFLLLGVVPLLWRSADADRLARVTLVLAALLPWLSTVGPFAIATDGSQRQGAPEPVAFISAMYQAVAAICTLVGLLRGTWHATARGALRVAWREDPALGIFALLWLAGGIGVAVYAGIQNRREALDNHLRAIVGRASNVRPAALTAFAQELHLVDVTPPVGYHFGHARIPEFGLEAAQNIGRELFRLGAPPPFTRWRGFTLLVDGWLVMVPGSDLPLEQGHVGLYRRATPEQAEAWKQKRPLLEIAPVPEVDRDLMTWAPVLDPQGRMLAWFGFGRVEFFATMHRRARVIPLLVTAMGLIVASALLLQRRATRERHTALHDAEVAAEANRLKTTFLAKVSHELRTPIQSVLGYSELLQRQVAGDPRAEAWLHALRQHGELMTRLVNDLIDLSAVEVGTFRLAPRPFAPAELVRQTVESLRPRAEAKGLALTCHIAADLPPRIRADAERLRQVILNLVGNAVKFTDQGGVTVNFERAPVGPDHRPRFALSVRDTGPGIPPAEQPRLFNAFARLEFTAHKEGSGLGLSLSAALCRAMDGDLTVESDGRSGACFTAVFAGENVESAEEATAPPVTGLNGRRVLVVDDNPLVRELFVTSLADAGATCRSAGTAAEALAALESVTPETIVLDLALPDEDGTRLAPKLRRAIPAVRIVGVSAHAGVSEREQALAAGMDAFLAKPVALAELAAAVAGVAATIGVAAPERPGLRQRLEAHFRAEVAPKRDELAAAVTRADFRRTRAVAHYLANSAAVVRDAPLLEACIALAQAAELADAAAVRAIWPDCESRLASWAGPVPTPDRHARAPG